VLKKKKLKLCSFRRKKIGTTMREAGHPQLMPVIIATQEAEIRRIAVQSQYGQIVLKTLSQKIPSQKRADGVTQGVGPEFKPHY
jgi:hypothetical protein